MYVDGQVWIMPEYRTGLIRLRQFCVLFAYLLSVIDFIGAFLVYIVCDRYSEPGQQSRKICCQPYMWLYMIIYDYTWLYMVIHGYVAIYGYLWFIPRFSIFFHYFSTAFSTGFSCSTECLVKFTECPRFVHGMSTPCPRHVHGMSTECPWNVC